MANSIIYSGSLKKFVSIVWEGQPIVSHYPKIRNHLRQNLGEDLAMLFAEPHITEEHLKGVGNAGWSSPMVSNKAVALQSLPTHEQTEVKYLLQTKLRKIGLYAQDLLASDNAENNSWGQLISKMLQIPDSQHILVENGKMVLVMWGFETESSKDSAYNFKQEFGLDKPIPTPVAEKKASLPTPTEPKDETANTQSTEQQEALPTQTEPEHKDEISNTQSFDKPEVLPAETEPKPDKPEVLPTQTEPAKQPTPEKKKPWYKKWWIWLIAIVILVLLVFGLRNCVPMPKPVPPLPKEVKKIVPIDTTKIVKAPDSIRSIVSDRLNVALMGENKNLGSFATKFKELYPGTDYQIIYYDTLTYRLQLQIPAEKREQIKKELPEKLKAFKPIVWHESLFQRNFTPSDPGFRDANKSWYHKQVKAIEAWDLVKGDSSLVIAVIDDGFDLSHPEFQGKIHKPWNVYTKSGAVNVGRKSFHGTHVAGIAVGAGGNGQGVSGIALNCKLMPIQVGDYDGTMGFTAIIDGILYAIHNGAKVVNMSLGMMIDKNTAKLPVAKQEEIVRTMFREEEQFWQQIFKAAYEKNIIFVLAAGNQNLLIGIDPFQRSKHTIKISATDINNRKANFSNFGDKSTLSAPGVQIYSSLPNGQFGNLDGTSMAAPIVAGGIALIKSANPALSFDQVVELLQNTALPVQNNAPYIGKIIQLDRALGIARDKRKENPKVDCPNVQDRIDSLLQVIEKLKKECAVNDETGDTLRLPAKENGERSDFSFAQGRWKSTTYIQDLTTGEPVTIYFDFLASGAGKITLIQSDNTNCSADLALSMGEGSLDINQTREAVCAPPPKTYSPYTFSCKPDANGYAECEAQNKTNTSNNFKFKLIKIR